MEQKEIYAILAAVAAVCIIIALGRAIRGPEESSAADPVVSATDASLTDDSFGYGTTTSTVASVSESAATSASSLSSADVTSDPFPTPTVIDQSTTQSENSAPSYTFSSSSAVSESTTEVSSQTFPQTFVIEQ